MSFQDDGGPEQVRDIIPGHKKEQKHLIIEFFPVDLKTLRNCAYHARISCHKTVFSDTQIDKIFKRH